MSQNTLIEKINNDAATTVAEIKSTGATEVESIQRETEAAIAGLKNEYDVALRKKKAQMELVAVSRAKQSGNIAVQSAKRAQINAVFTEVIKELEEQSANDYVTFFQKHATSIVPKTIKIDHVHAPATRLEETKKVLVDLGLSGEVIAEASIKAGFVVYAKDGVYDITLDRLMKERRSELEMMVVSKVMS